MMLMMIEVHNNNKVVVHVAASVLLLLLLASSFHDEKRSLWAAEAQFMPDFCTARSIMASAAAPFGGGGGGGQRGSCPAPATANNLDLSTLLGSYYEIGSTARYKVKYELGMACSRTTFSTSSHPAPSDNDDGDGDDNGDGDDIGGVDADGGLPIGGGGSSYSPLINVVSSGVPVVFGRQTLAAVGRIAAAASGVCSTAERLCAMSSPQSRITEALLRISAVMDQIPVPGADATALAQASAAVNGSVAAIRARLDRLARSVSGVAGMNAGLSQAAGGPVAADLLLRTLRASADVGMEVAREVGAFAINNLTFAANLLDAVATRNSIAASSSSSSSSSAAAAASDTQRLLQDASTLLQEELQLVSAQVTFIQGLLSSVGGPLADMVGAERRSAAAAAAAAAAGNTSRVVLRSGQATQDSQERGSMILRTTGGGGASSSSSDFADTSSTTTTTSTPFRVLALVPPGIGEYTAVLINTCDATFSGSGVDGEASAASSAAAAPPPFPQPELLLLSRTPTLTPQTVLDLLNAAASHGIFADCDSPFVPTLQRPDDCSFY